VTSDTGAEFRELSALALLRRAMAHSANCSKQSQPATPHRVEPPMHSSAAWTSQPTNFRSVPPHFSIAPVVARLTSPHPAGPSHVARRSSCRSRRSSITKASVSLSAERRGRGRSTSITAAIDPGLALIT
jgi:hypothetical protein